MRLGLGVCEVRSWRPGDAASIVEHANNRKVWVNLRDRFPHPYTASDARDFLKSVLSARPETNFAIDVDGAAVGGIAYRVQSDVERIGAELGYWLGEKFWGRGIATAAVRAVTEHALATPGLLRVFALPFAHNRASARVLEKAGFALEGVLRSSAMKDGRVLDQLLYARIRA
ncbi:MAG TPA: GNAT family N-acetyltransferase [Methylomirabilota bacterium]|jgi:RimJ/RimL family protein N-acetyltransferase